MTYRFALPIPAWMIAIPALTLLFVWSCVPVEKSKTDKSKTTPFNKIRVVYNDPPWWILLSGLVTYAFGVFVQSRASDISISAWFGRGSHIDLFV
jgi:hypothetical protein